MFAFAVCTFGVRLTFFLDQCPEMYYSHFELKTSHKNKIILPTSFLYGHFFPGKCWHQHPKSDLESADFLSLSHMLDQDHQYILRNSSAKRLRTPSHYINIILMLLPIFSHLHLPKSSYPFNTCTLYSSNHIRPKATCSYSSNILWWFLDWKHMYILPQINKYYITWPIGPSSPTNLSFCAFAFTRLTGESLFRSLKPTPPSKHVFSR